MSEQTARPGRPRSTKADTAILAAARELLAEGGLGNLTVEGTAARAGVAKTTIYRRYPTKLDLAVGAIADLVAEPPPPTDTIEDRTAQGIRDFQVYMGAPGSQAAYLAVAAAAAADPEIHDRFTKTVLASIRTNIEESVASAQEHGEASNEPPVDFIYDVAMGTLIHRQIIRKQPMSPEFAQMFTDLMKHLYTLQD